ncbi:phosphate ABC transporter membrane protein 2, PhoT family [Desulfonispora thiosulfatigenes DSM 11270]|uniref:Phosphate transport system permease protein PstA n=1 Tax=Desulfonispora thiosulfatigenes DSM 11270 TaxID=656914 RepID=A0A1W1VF74_DESTI|nr:phosphate ABC transporter permease PstA [Desulfonispora thiosulfatigenes]SMB91870.1 phosphate ABC transporter membrane protein 2, PhoT family [Desulfonispora thiosulfatigenes DSM 11270]
MREKIKDSILKVWITICVIIVFTIVMFIFGYIFKNGVGSINLEFILSDPKGIPIGSEGGIFPAIIGSLFLMLIACILAFILAISTSIYTVFYCRSKRMEGVIHLIIQSMAGIPSIILGLFGYTLLVLYLNLGRSLLSGGITLGIMIFPYIQVRIEKTLREVEINIVEASYALGVSKSYTIYKLILPMCRADIISTITMAGGYAMGAAAPIILTAAVIFAPIPKSLSSPVMALPFHLYILTGEGISLEKAYGTALVLIMILLILNIVSIILNMKRRGDR